MFEFDGAMGEGGGAILRVGAGLACTTNQPVRFKNIRKNRKMPGLRLQHLLGIQTVARITNRTNNSFRDWHNRIRFDSWVRMETKVIY